MTPVDLVQSGVCHADRAVLLAEVARCVERWRLAHSPDFRGQLIQEAEAALLAACARLGQIPDCSE